MNAREIEVHISELVLHGFPPGAGNDIGDAVKAELTRLLTTGETPERLRATTNFDRLAGAPVRGSAAPTDLGTEIARSVHRTLTPTNEERRP